MKTFEDFTQVVHKAMGSEPMVVIPWEQAHDPRLVRVRRARQSTGGTVFDEETFYADELETPIESIEREALIFEALNAKKREAAEKDSPRKVSHLN